MPARTNEQIFTRRNLIRYAAASAAMSLWSASAPIPLGLELYSVRDELAKDLDGTLRAVAKMGYQAVEFYAPYYTWTAERAKHVRTLMDEVGIRCYSTHNGPASFASDGLQKALELNKILGSKYVIMANAGKVLGLDGWRKVAEQLTTATEFLRKAGLAAGYHNHKFEFLALEGKRPMDILAENTPQSVVLQLDVGTCIEAGQDPVGWITSHPGRIKSIHCKDWAPGENKGFQVLFGEGVSPWKAIINAAESPGGVEYYLIEQEGSRFSSLETAQRCLETWRTIHK